MLISSKRQRSAVAVNRGERIAMIITRKLILQNEPKRAISRYNPLQGTELRVIGSPNDAGKSSRSPESIAATCPQTPILQNEPKRTAFCNNPMQGSGLQAIVSSLFSCKPFETPSSTAPTGSTITSKLQNEPKLAVSCNNPLQNSTLRTIGLPNNAGKSSRASASIMPARPAKTSKLQNEPKCSKKRLNLLLQNKLQPMRPTIFGSACRNTPFINNAMSRKLTFGDTAKMPKLAGRSRLHHSATASHNPALLHYSRYPFGRLITCNRIYPDSASDVLQKNVAFFVPLRKWLVSGRTGSGMGFPVLLSPVCFEFDKNQMPDRLFV